MDLMDYHLHANGDISQQLSMTLAALQNPPFGHQAPSHCPSTLCQVIGYASDYMHVQC